MIDTIKSKLEDTFKEAVDGVSTYTLISIIAYTTLINFQENHPGMAICTLLNTDISNIAGENSYILKIKIKEIILATISTLTAATIINLIRSEFFDLLYETILPKYISSLKTAPNSKIIDLETATKNLKKSCHSQNTLILITIALAITAYYDGMFYYCTALTAATLLLLGYSIHASAKQLISQTLPAIISKSPDISREELDKLFSNPDSK